MVNSSEKVIFVPNYTVVMETVLDFVPADYQKMYKKIRLVSKDSFPLTTVEIAER